ncbi:MAG: LysR family transcriptional regulator [Kofleriaceae bacterium]
MIELRHLRAFEVLAEELHFGRTARRLGLAQPAVSQTIKALELEVGATLFERTRREVHLSRAGEAFLVHVRTISTSLARAADAARAAHLGATGRVVVRCAIASSLTPLPGAIATLRKRHPGVHVDLAPAPTFDQLAQLRTGACDVGVVPMQRDIAPLAVHPIHASPLAVAVPTGHAFAKRARVALAQLAGADLVFLRASGEPATVGRFRARCRAAGFDPRIVLETDSLEMMACAVAAGIGIATITADIARLQFPHVAVVPLSPQIMTTHCVAWNPSNPNPAAATLVALLKEAARFRGSTRREPDGRSR